MSAILGDGVGHDEYGIFADFSVTPSDAPEVAQRMRWIPPGKFSMGEESNVDEVTLTKAIWIFDTPCTQALWVAVMGNNPSYFEDPDLNRPVEQVSWDKVQEFLEKLNELADLRLRLPTEAEWEYCCRAGTTTATYTGDIEILAEFDAPDLDPIAWYGGNCGIDFDLTHGFDMSDVRSKQYDFAQGGTRQVALKQPNKWGLYDMLGNVWEWCQDWYGLYERRKPVNPLGPVSGKDRVIRGGSWSVSPHSIRSAFRSNYPPHGQSLHVGFRCVEVQDAADPTGGASPSSRSDAIPTGGRVGDSTTDPASTRSTDVVWLESYSNDNRVIPLQDKLEENSKFKCQTNLRIHVGNEPIQLLEFEGVHHGHGIRCFPLKPEFHVGSDEMEFAKNSDSQLAQPLTLEANCTTNVMYIREHRPPVMTMTAEECEFGDFEFTLRCRRGDQTEAKVFNFIFEFQASGELNPVDAVRQVPRFNDDHLRELCDKGRISRKQLDDLLGYDAGVRYRAERSDNMNENYLGLPDRLRLLLKSLYDASRFLTEDHLKAIVGISKKSDYEQAEAVRLIFRTKKQRTWLVTTRTKLFLLLDDEKTREKNRIIQWSMPKSTCTPIRARTYKQRSGLLDIGRRKNWYYSTSLFPTPADIESTVRQIVE